MSSSCTLSLFLLVADSPIVEAPLPAATATATAAAAAAAATTTTIASPSLTEQDSQQKLTNEARELLDIVVQLGNRQEIEQLQNRIKVKSHQHDENTQYSFSFLFNRLS